MSAPDGTPQGQDDAASDSMARIFESKGLGRFGRRSEADGVATAAGTRAAATTPPPSLGSASGSLRDVHPNSEASSAWWGIAEESVAPPSSLAWGKANASELAAATNSEGVSMSTTARTASSASASLDSRI